MCSCSWSTDPSPHRQSPPWSVAEAQNQVVYLITASFAAMHIAILSRFEHQWVYVNTFVVVHSTHRNADLQQSKKNVPLRKLQTGSSYGAVHEVMWERRLVSQLAPACLIQNMSLKCHSYQGELLP